MKFLEEAKFKYELSIDNLVYQARTKVSELLDAQLIKSTFQTARVSIDQQLYQEIFQ